MLESAGGPGELQLLPKDSLRFAALAAKHVHPVLLLGETGSGKTYLAKRIHALSNRAGEPFVRVNCAEGPGALFEDQMFGHVRGAFTDARESRPGFFELADRGTLFLDELGEIPLVFQATLLTAIEEGEVRRLGGTRPIGVDLRLLSATNRRIDAMIEEGTFRADLFHRCAVLQHRLRPLRERPRDIPAIIHALLMKNLPPHASKLARRISLSFLVTAGP